MPSPNTHYDVPLFASEEAFSCICLDSPRNAVSFDVGCVTPKRPKIRSPAATTAPNRVIHSYSTSGGAQVCCQPAALDSRATTQRLNIPPRTVQTMPAVLPCICCLSADMKKGILMAPRENEDGTPPLVPSTVLLSFPKVSRSKPEMYISPPGKCVMKHLPGNFDDSVGNFACLFHSPRRLFQEEAFRRGSTDRFPKSGPRIRNRGILRNSRTRGSSIRPRHGWEALGRLRWK